MSGYEHDDLRQRGNFPEKFRMSVDPGLGGTGFALWSGASEWKKMRPPFYTDVILPKHWENEYRVSDWLEDRCRGVAYALSPYATMGCEAVYIEFPENWGGSLKGQTAQRRGDLLKLATLIGTMNGIFMPCEVILVSVRQWKGQMSKDAVIKRIERKLGQGTCRQLRIESHAWDAVGIGLNAKGFF